MKAEWDRSIVIPEVARGAQKRNEPGNLRPVRVLTKLKVSLRG
jgi:hypothetical protein